MALDLTKYALKLREDFSLMLVPAATKEIERKERDTPVDRDYSNTAEKGYVISPAAKRKIRSAAFGLYLKCSRDEQLNLRFVTFTFPSLPDYLKDLSKVEQDAELQTIFLKFLDNERNNYGLKQ